MGNILLVLTNTRMSNESITAAITTVKEEKKKLFILFVVDEERSGESAIEKMADEGWMGSKVSDDLYKTIENEYKLFGEAKIKEIEKRAEEEDIPYSTIIEEGNFVPTVLEVIKKEEISLVITTRRNRSRLSRFMFGSAVEEIKKICSCEVRIIDE